jgi:peroxiredoxin
MKRGLLMHVTVLVLIALLAGSAQAAEQEEGLAVGQKAPDFTLTDVDGNTHTLSGLAGKPVVLIFTSQECPWVRGATSDLSAVAKKYADAGVTFIGIDANRSNTPEEIKNYATENSVAYPIVKDENNVYADLVGATRTPEIFVLNAEQTVVYHGAFDDRKVPEESGATNYLDLALASVLAGEEVATKDVAAWGCGIQRVPKQDAAAAADADAALTPSAAPADGAHACPMGKAGSDGAHACPMGAKAESEGKTAGDSCCATKKEGDSAKKCPVTGATAEDSGTTS